MYVIKKLRLNKFERRPIVSNKALFLANGSKPAVIDSKESADCFDQPTLEGASKTKVLGLANEISTRAIEHAKSNEVPTLSHNAKDM